VRPGDPGGGVGGPLGGHAVGGRLVIGAAQCCPLPCEVAQSLVFMWLKLVLRLVLP
jgi:hypothetical protein